MLCRLSTPVHRNAPARNRPQPLKKVRRGPFRSHSVSGANRPTETQIAWWQETRGVGHSQCGGVADREREAPDCTESADGAAAVTGCTQLVVARIRNARWVLAPIQGADRAQHPGHPGVKRQCL